MDAGLTADLFATAIFCVENDLVDVGSEEQLARILGRDDCVLATDTCECNVDLPEGAFFEESALMAMLELITECEANFKLENGVKLQS